MKPPSKPAAPARDSAIQALLEARHGQPGQVLGPQPEGAGVRVRVFLPGAREARLLELDQAFERVSGTDLFELRAARNQIPGIYHVRWVDRHGRITERADPYCLPPQLAEFDLHLFGEGRHWHIYRWLGAHPHAAEGLEGTLFAVWAPNAQRVSVVGDFNDWDGRAHPMHRRGGGGIWELFLPGIGPGSLYKFEIRGPDGDLFVKSDPFGSQFQPRPDNAAVAAPASAHRWADDQWMNHRGDGDWQRKPLSIYEVHLGSWQLDEAGGFLNYRELARRLAVYLKEQGFTHLELLPITEHPLDASWGYQTTGYFAPTSRFGSPDDFRWFVDHLHQNGIGVLLDWAPAHFPRDAHALARFDGTALYEHADPRQGEHRDWGTLIFNYGRKEVTNFLLASAVCWMQEFHIDGLRVDAVASMLYLDYSRDPGDWVPNQYGGRENLEAVTFLRELNQVVLERFPGALMIAEESTAWPQVTRPSWLGGLGFSMKWNMGWMHDTLSYMEKDPIYRHYHHHLLTFGLEYAFGENFVLPYSHDEVVHGKGSMLGKMLGDRWRRFASLRLLYSFMFTYPGKKLLFMGAEFGEEREWSEARGLDWELLDQPEHRGLHALVRDLNRLYREQPALYGLEFKTDGFAWIDCHDASQSVISFIRRDADGTSLVAVLNFTPMPREDYRIGVPEAAGYREIFNSDSAYYGGSNLGNAGWVEAEPVRWMGRARSISLTLPPLGAIVLRPEPAEALPETPATHRGNNRS